MIREGFIQVVANEPTHAEPVSRKLHQVPFGAKDFKEHHEVQLEEDHRINGGATSLRIGPFDQVAHKRQIHDAVQVTVEMMSWNELIERDRCDWREETRFGS